MKKIFDIFPPKKIEKREIKELPKEKSPKKLKFKKNLVLGFSLVLILVGVIAYFNLIKAEIKIWPETEILNFETKLIVDKFAERPNFSEKVLPGRVFTAEKTVSEEFPASGKKLKSAEGRIRLYNQYTTKPEVWLEGTRFISPEGKIFKSKSKIAVPGAKLEKGKLIPSYVDVEVIAAEPGANYNIDHPTKFAIYIYRGTPRYTKYWGESLEPITGGGEVPQVTEEDLEKAEAKLIEKAKEEVVSTLKNEIPAEFDFFAEAVKTEILEKFSNAKSGDELEKFTFQVKAASQILSPKKEELQNLAFNFVSGQIPSEKKIQKINYSLNKVNLEDEKMALSLAIEAKIYSAIDEMNLKKEISKKSLTETKFFLENLPGIKRIEVKFWPFWLRKVPEDLRKIEIKLNLD